MSEILINSKDEKDLKNLIKNHVKYTNSEKGAEILLNWREELKKFKKVIPRDYEKILDKLNLQRKRVKVNG
jgi:glutamate synthase (ferredoxin)